jgi:urease accessory protein
MVQGDCYAQELVLQPESRVCLTSQAASRIYRMETGCACYKEAYYIGPGAILEYWPDPIIPYSNSRFSGNNDIYVDEKGSVLMAETLYPGRAARGELFAYDYYRRRTRLYYRGELVYYDLVNLEPKAINPQSLGIFERYAYYGQILLFSPVLDIAMSDYLHQLLQGQEELIGSASCFYPTGIIVRLLAANSLVLKKAMAKCWEVSHQKILGCTLPFLRKY